MDTDQYFDSLVPFGEQPIFDQSAGGFIIPGHSDLGSFPRSYKDAVHALARKRGILLTCTPDIQAQDDAQH